MGHDNPERWRPVEWRSTAETVGEMVVQDWDVLSHCLHCGLNMRVDLRLIVRLKGPRVSLWNRRQQCRRIGCVGMVEFQGRPPGRSQHMRLEADWPPHRLRHPPGRR